MSVFLSQSDDLPESPLLPAPPSPDLLISSPLSNRLNSLTHTGRVHVSAVARKQIQRNSALNK